MPSWGSGICLSTCHIELVRDLAALQTTHTRHQRPSARKNYNTPSRTTFSPSCCTIRSPLHLCQLRGIHSARAAAAFLIACAHLFFIIFARENQANTRAASELPSGHGAGILRLCASCATCGIAAECHAWHPMATACLIRPHSILASLTIRLLFTTHQLYGVRLHQQKGVLLHQRPTALHSLV